MNTTATVNKYFNMGYVTFGSPGILIHRFTREENRKADSCSSYKLDAHGFTAMMPLFLRSQWNFPLCHPSPWKCSWRYGWLRFTYWLLPGVVMGNVQCSCTEQIQTAAKSPVDSSACHDVTHTIDNTPYRKGIKPHTQLFKDQSLMVNSLTPHFVHRVYMRVSYES
jgi:hypothetical protein